MILNPFAYYLLLGCADPHKQSLPTGSPPGGSPTTIERLASSGPSRLSAHGLCDYVRVVSPLVSDQGDRRWIIQTSARFLRHPTEDRTIVLVSIQHLGDPRYFDGLEHYITDADVVINEGPSPDEPESRPGLRGELRWMGKLETLFSTFLSLRTQGQWEGRVRTTKWITADLSDVETETIARESGLVLLSDEYKVAIDRLLSLDPMKLDNHALAEAKEWLYRLLYAPFFGDGNNLLSSRPWLMLMERREMVMLEVLKKVLERRPAPRKVVLILGAFHVPPMEEYLRNVAGYALWGSHWHDAVSYSYVVGR